MKDFGKMLYVSGLISLIGVFACVQKRTGYFASTAGSQWTDVLTLNGDAHNESFGHAVASAGDFNGDGFGDIIVGAPFHNISNQEGRACVFLGKESPPSSVNASEADLIIESQSFFQHLGNSVAFAGDVNNDGFDDIIIGSWYYSKSGNAYVFYGGSLQDEIEGEGIQLDPSSADIVITGPEGVGSFGISVSSAGDLDGDGIDDFIVGASSAAGPDGDGGVYIFKGSTSLSNTLNAEAAQWKIFSESDDPWSGFGSAIAAVGDLNFDGRADIAIGHSSWGHTNGRVYVFFGKTLSFGEIIASSANVIISGDEHDGLGRSISSAGNVNGDNFDDLIVGGAVTQFSNWTEPGKVWVILGKYWFPSEISAQEASLQIIGEDPDDAFGYSVSCASDYDGDGFDDILIGAPRAGKKSTGSYWNEGKCYLFRGSTQMTGTLNAISADFVFQPSIMYGAVYYSFGSTVAGGLDVNGDDVEDLLIGAENYGSGQVVALSYSPIVP